MSEAAGGIAKVLVIGAQGVLGKLCVTALRDAGLTVVRAGRRPEDAADFRLIDLDDPRSVEEGCADVDLVISTVHHPAHAAERLVLRTGGTLLSTAGMRLAERRDLAAGAGGSSGLVVLDAGLAPGVSSLVLKELLAEHPEADRVESAGTFSAIEPSGYGAADDFHYGFGLKRRFPTRVIEFPAPVGRRRCLEFEGPEIEATILGSLLEGREGRVYMCLLERPVNAEFLALNALGLLSKLPPSVFSFGSDWKLRRMVAKPQTHPVTVLRGGRPLAANVIEGSGNYVMSAAAVVVYAEALLRRRGEGRPASGVRGVEDVFDLFELREHFEAHGIRIRPLPV